MKLILAAALLTLATTFGPAVYGPPEGGPHMPERGSRIAAVAALHAAAQRPGAARASNPTSTATLPPILMTCPHHPDVLETKPGTCPVCRLPLVPVRIDSAWM